MSMRGFKAIPRICEATGRVRFLLDALTALLITFTAACLLIRASVAIVEENVDLLAFWMAGGF